MTRLIVFSLAVWRMSRMITHEEGPFGVFRETREWLGVFRGDSGDIIQAPEYPSFVRVLLCVGCTSVWVAAMMWRVPQTVQSILAGSAVAKLLDDYLYGNG